VHEESPLFLFIKRLCVRFQVWAMLAYCSVSFNAAAACVNDGGSIGAVFSAF
jgi:hypothetical protein